MKRIFNLKSFISMLLVVVMLLALLTSCENEPTSQTSQDQSQVSGSESDPDVIDELTLPLTETKKELTVWTLYVNAFFPDPNDLPSVQKLEELTNVHINWVPVGLAELSEKLTQLMISSDLPDIIYIAGMEIPGGAQAAVDSGFIVEVSELVRKYMPNYRAIVNSDPSYKRDILSDEGKQNYVTCFNADVNGPAATTPFIGLTVRKDLLDKYEMAIPETISEWYTTLKFFKEKGMTMPLKVSGLGVPAGGAFITAYGITTGFYMDGDTVKFGGIEPGYKQWLQEMNKWYSEGLIDQNFMSVTEGAYMPDAAAVSSDNTLAFATLFTFTHDGLVTSGFTKNADCRLVGVPNPVMNKGDRPKAPLGLTSPVSHPIYITSGCEDTELAAKWLDYQFTIDGMLLNFLGPEGVTYNKSEDGTVTFTDLVTNNPDGKKPSDVISAYARGNGLGMYLGTFSQMLEPGSKKFEAIGIWADQDNMDLPLKAAMTSDEQQDYNEKFTAISTIYAEKTVKYITGQESFDTYDQFIQTMKDYGIEDCIAYKQAAVDRYMRRG